MILPTWICSGLRLQRRAQSPGLGRGRRHKRDVPHRLVLALSLSLTEPIGAVRPTFGRRPPSILTASPFLQMDRSQELLVKAPPRSMAERPRCRMPASRRSRKRVYRAIAASRRGVSIRLWRGWCRRHGTCERSGDAASARRRRGGQLQLVRPRTSSAPRRSSQPHTAAAYYSSRPPRSADRSYPQ